MPQCDTVCCSALQSVAMCCIVLQCVALCCSVMQCVAECDVKMEGWRVVERALKKILKSQFATRFTTESDCDDDFCEIL